MDLGCAPCEAAALHGLGDVEPGALQPDMKRDLIAGATAFALPLGYHYAAPKKWPRANVFVNLGAVVVLYFGTRWALQKFQPGA